MKQRPLLLHEIGSLAKPSWRVKPFKGMELNNGDIEKAKYFGELLDIDGREGLINLLEKRNNFNSKEKDEIIHFSSLYATKLLEKAGLDLVYDGEQHRIEMYEHPIRRIEGFEFKGHVRSFDNKYYNKAACVGDLKLKDKLHLDEFERIQSFTEKPVKIPITGAYTLVDWSYDECFIKDISAGEIGIRDKKRKARSRFFNEMSIKIIYPTIENLIEMGAEYIQIDEPAATTKRDEITEFISTIKDSIGDLCGRAFFSVHICFSDYSLLFPHINELEGYINEVHLEYANRDTREPGVESDKRKGYEILNSLKDTSFIVGLGVLDVHTDYIEPPQLIRDRILYANEVIGDPDRLFIAPDCGLRTRTWDVVYEKLKSMVEGRNLASREMGLE